MDFFSFSVAFAPHVPLWLMATFAALALIILAFSVYRRAHGAWARLIAFMIVLLALANPLVLHETREGLSNIVALVVDRSQSMEIGTRRADADKAVAAYREQLKALNVEVREAEVLTSTDAGAETGGTALFTALNAALSDAPPDRVAGAIVITDGEVHDAPDPRTFHLGSPFHVLVTGAPGERDRKLTVVRATRYNIVGREAQITFRVDDFGGSAGGNAQVALRIDGQASGNRQVPVGRDTTISVPVAHGGENVVELEAAAGPAEQTLQNNRAAVMVNGVRDRLRVLLVSGEPHAGERVWRNLLKADPSVDLVHFTILRPPEKLDSTPINELALIQFPTRQLFAEKLSEFDLVILDRYQNRDLLPLAYFENLAKYVENGGALLLSSGSGIRRRHQHLPHAARRRPSGAADRRSRQRRVQARDHQGRLRASRHARSAARQSRSRTDGRERAAAQSCSLGPRRNAGTSRHRQGRHDAELGPLVPRHHRRDASPGNTLMSGAPGAPASRARPRAEGPRRAAAVRSDLALGARLRERRPAGRASAPSRALADEGARSRRRAADGRSLRRRSPHHAPDHERAGGRSESHEPDRQGADRAADA